MITYHLRHPLYCLRGDQHEAQHAACDHRFAQLESRKGLRCHGVVRALYRSPRRRQRLTSPTTYLRQVPRRRRHDALTQSVVSCLTSSTDSKSASVDVYRGQGRLIRLRAGCGPKEASATAAPGEDAGELSGSPLVARSPVHAPVRSVHPTGEGDPQLSEETGVPALASSNSSSSRELG